MKTSKPNENTVYYLALLDWREKILSPDDMERFTKNIISSPLPPTDSWTIGSLSWPELKSEVREISIGYYHSRLIFRCSLISVPEKIRGIRILRTQLKKKLRDFLIESIIPAMEQYTKNPRIFIYPIFEIQNDEPFWKFDTQKPFSLPTTCFYTELEDPRQGRLSSLSNTLYPRKAKMRVSGAKIITSEMSDWFFWNLVNIVFHEGLYRQSRESKFKANSVHAGVENRLEDFASNLMTTFYEVSNARAQDLIAKFALSLAILGIILGFIYFIYPLCSQLITPSSSPTNTTSTNSISILLSELLY